MINKSILLIAWKCSRCVMGTFEDQAMDADTTRSFEIPVRYLAAVAEKYLLEMALNFIK